MAETIQKITRLVVGDESATDTVSATGASMERTTLTVPAATAGTLTTRTDANTGVITLPGGHGLTSGTFDVFWSGGSRRGMTCTITVNAMAIDGGSGTDLPATTTAMGVMKPVSQAVELNGDNAVAVAVYGARGGYVAYLDAEGADIKAYGPLDTPNGGDGWVTGDGGTNPLAEAEVASITFSHGYSGAAAEMRSRVAYGTPL